MSSLKIISSILLTFGLLGFVLVSIGGGHGTYLYAKIFYPYTMIIAIIFEKIGFIAFILALFQIPIYTLLIESKPKYIYYIPVIHVIAAIICMFLPSETFY